MAKKDNGSLLGFLATVGAIAGVVATSAGGGGGQQILGGAVGGLVMGFVVYGIIQAAIDMAKKFLAAVLSVVLTLFSLFIWAGRVSTVARILDEDKNTPTSSSRDFTESTTNRTPRKPKEITRRRSRRPVTVTRERGYIDETEAVCLINSSSDKTIKYEYRWGDQDWQTRSIAPYRRRVHWFNLYSVEDPTPEFHVRFNQASGSQTLFVERVLETYRIEKPVKCNDARRYEFVLEGTGRLGLASRDWLPGWPHPFKSNLFASKEEDVWMPGPGYGWLNEERLEAIADGHGIIGIEIHLNEDRFLPEVMAVYPGSPGDIAGLRAGDFILEVQGQPARWPVSEAIIGPAGSYVEMLVEDRQNASPVTRTVRAERTAPGEVERMVREARAKLEQLERQEAARNTDGIIGITIALNEALDLPQVNEVYPGSPAALAGLRAGDFILEVQGRPAQWPVAAEIMGPSGSFVTLSVSNEAGGSPKRLVRIKRTRREEVERMVREARSRAIRDEDIPRTSQSQDTAPRPRREWRPLVHKMEEMLPARRISGKDSEYTPAARRAGIQGVVILDLLIDEKGRVEGVEVVEGLPFGLTKQATKAVRDWLFEPARRGNVPIASTYRVRMAFELPRNN